jgi:hypothetical protein
MTPEEVGQIIKTEIDHKVNTPGAPAFTLGANLAVSVFGERLPCPLLFAADRVAHCNIEPTAQAMADVLGIQVEQVSCFIMTIDNLGETNLTDEWSQLAVDLIAYGKERVAEHSGTVQNFGVDHLGQVTADRDI